MAISNLRFHCQVNSNTTNARNYNNISHKASFYKIYSWDDRISSWFIVIQKHDAAILEASGPKRFPAQLENRC